MAAPLRMGTRGKQLFRVAIKCKWSERSDRVGENKREREQAKSKGNEKRRKTIKCQAEAESGTGQGDGDGEGAGAAVVGVERKQGNKLASAAFATRRKASAPMPTQFN